MVNSPRYAHRSTKVALAFVFSTFAVISTATELRTYQIDSDQARLFRFAGGLLGTNVSAQLAGSFDVAIDNGTATLTRFDVQLIDIADASSPPATWPSSQPLAQLLHVNPVGLTGVSNSTLTYLSSNTFPPVITNDPQTTVELLPGVGPLARLTISSSWGAHDVLTFVTDAPGFSAQLVPEPSAIAIAILGAIAAVIGARSRRKLT